MYWVGAYFMFSMVKIHHCPRFQGLVVRAKYSLSFARVAELNPHLQSA